jgi:hypothetical protein
MGSALAIDPNNYHQAVGYKFLDTDGTYNNLLSIAVAAPNINAHFVSDYTKQAGATVADVIFGYNADWTNFKWYSHWSGTNTQLMALTSDGNLSAIGSLTIGAATNGEVMTVKSNLATGGNAFFGFYPDVSNPATRWGYFGYAGGAGVLNWYWNNAQGSLYLIPKVGAAVYLAASATFPTYVDSAGFLYPRSQQYADPRADGTRSEGSKVILYSQFAANKCDYAIGVGGSANMWFTCGDAGAGLFEFYRPTGSGNTVTKIASLNQAGVFALPQAGSYFSARGSNGWTGTQGYKDAGGLNRTLTIVGGLVIST